MYVSTEVCDGRSFAEAFIRYSSWYNIVQLKIQPVEKSINKENSKDLTSSKERRKTACFKEIVQVTWLW
jgi:hypothetical protein